MKARIYRPSKTVVQSGHGKTDLWLLEYEPVSSRQPEALMGWTESGDTTNQVRLKFTTLEEATEFARKKGLEYSISGPHERRIRPRNYGDNFRYIAEDSQ